MAVALMQKIGILAHIDLKPEITGELQHLGLLHIEDLRDLAGQEEWKELVSPDEITDAQLETDIADVNVATDFLLGFAKKGFLAGLSGTKVHLTQDEYQSLTDKYDWKNLGDRCKKLTEERKEIISESDTLNSQKKMLLPWASLTVPVEEVTSTKNVEIFAGTVPHHNFAEFQKGLQESEARYYLEIVQAADDRAYLVVFHHRQDKDIVDEILNKTQFSQVTFPGMTGTAQDLIERIEQRYDELIQRAKGIENEGRALAQYLNRLIVIGDHLQALLERRKIPAKFARTSKTFFIDGWIRSSHLPLLKERLKEKFKQAAVFEIEPRPGEVAPSDYRNSKMVRPFELITSLYGAPSYFEADPTPAIVPFFLIFFAMCLTDAGYGMVLATLSLLGLKWLRVGANMRKLLKILFAGGLITTLLGALTGGYFGINFEELPPSLGFLTDLRSKIMLLDPLKEPLHFWIVGLVLGYIQLNVGVLVKFYWNLKNRRLLDAFVDQVSWLMLINSLVLFGFAKAGIVAGWIGSLSMAAAVVGAALIVLFYQREEKNPLARFFWGIYGLYGVTGYLSDILSYTRLFALGMATAVIAMMVNVIAGMVSNIPLVGIVLMLVVLIVGHLFNIAINVLSGFIHTLRLQFMEFFSKFYEGSGRPLRPFAFNFENSVIERRK
ncbi:MAG: V-type ATP synthase subunit I [Deltaproteobacteria bacterium]|nr:MAG: V-type ATP synthase subunit I [Deltaproteobacteria bacterium]